MKYLLVVVASAVFLAGCKELPVIVPADGNRHVAAALPKVEKPALLYIYREAKGMTESYPRTIFVDGRPLGQLVGNTYFMLKVGPGQHVISSPGTNVSVVSVNAESGGTYYFSQEVIPSIKAPFILLNKVDEATGKQGVAKGVMLTVQRKDDLLSFEPKPVVEKPLVDKSAKERKSAAEKKSAADNVLNVQPADRLRELKRLFKEGLINEQEYAEKKKKILEGI